MSTNTHATPACRIDWPRTPADLVALQCRRPRRGACLVPRWPYGFPESFFRLTLSFADADSMVSNARALVQESSPLFWDGGTPAQVLLWADCGDAKWSLSLTRWGALRWECSRATMKRPVALECRTPLSCFVTPPKPFCVGVTLARSRRDGKTTVRLLAGEPGAPLAVIAREEHALPAGVEHPASLLAGQGPRRYRPMDARPLELLAAGTELHQIYQGQWQGNTGVSAPRANQSALACRVDSRTVLAYPSPSLAGTRGNYWHHFAVTDPRIRVVRLPVFNEMSTRFFWSADHVRWSALRCRVVPYGGAEARCAEVALPRRRGVIHIANAPVYDEARRDTDLVAAERAGAIVQTAAISRGGLPVHVVELTNRAVPLKGKVGVVLLCGQHSPLEQMTGFLGLPLITEMARLNAAPGPAHGILDRLAVYWIPIFNVDCSRRGLPGNTLDGANPNRHWFKGKGPEQTGVERFFLERRREGLRFGLMIDGHGGGVWRNHTILSDYHLPHTQVEKAAGFGRARKPLPFSPADTLKHEWFRALLRHAGLREVWENGVATPTVCRAPEWFQKTFGCPAITIECSVVSQFDAARQRTAGFALEPYRALGGCLARAFAASMSLLAKGARCAPQS